METDKRYVIISPCRNEAKFMRRTLDSVVAQTVNPTLWIIVDDGSTDDTPSILAEYAAQYEFIRIVTRDNRGHRSVGPGVIDAFYAGYETISIDDFDFICKLDLDLELPRCYFAELIVRMEKIRDLAIVVENHIILILSLGNWSVSIVVTKMPLEPANFIESLVLSRLMGLYARLCGMVLMAIVVGNWGG